MYSRTTPLPYTLLSLPRYAQMTGINPAHFVGAITNNVNPAIFPDDGSCTDLWPRHAWQNHDHISREELALEIQKAERDIADVCHFWPAPVWTPDERHQFPHDLYRTSMYQISDVRGFPKGITVDYGRIIAPGVRKADLVATVSQGMGADAFDFVDDDGDGFSEVVELNVTNIATTTDVNELKIYFSGENGDPDWEVRPVFKKSLVGGLFVARFSSLLILDPDLQAAYPSAQFQALDAMDVTNYVGRLQVYREYNDTTAASSKFYWEPLSGGGLPMAGVACPTCGGSGCVACAQTTQDGCLHVRDFQAGAVVPVPASYTAAGGWTATCFSECRAPDNVALWYLSGDVDPRYSQGRSFDPLSDFWAWTIIYLATARLHRAPCGCGHLNDLYEDLSVDVSHAESGSSYFIPATEMSNPFGTRRGELMAWKRISGFPSRRRTIGVSI